MLYLIFCLATAITSYLFLVSEPLKAAILFLDMSDPLVQHPFLTGAVALLMLILVAPVLVVVLLSNKLSDIFRDTLYDTLTCKN